MTIERKSPSHHPNKLNIYDELGCQIPVPDGELILCNACCHWFELMVAGKLKPRGEKCIYCGEGCEIHNAPDQPVVCQCYHCSREMKILFDPCICDPAIRHKAAQTVIGLLTVSYEHSKISKEFYEERRAYILRLEFMCYGPDEVE